MQIDLIDGNDHRYARIARMADGLDGLGHDLVVRGNHEDDDVGDLSAAGSHGGEGLVTRRIQEGDPLVARQLDVVGADVLGNAAGLSCNDIGFADVIEQ